MVREAVIVEAVRTPVGRGRPGGALSGWHPVDLAVDVADYLGIATDSASVTSVKDTIGPDLVAEYRIPKTWNAAAFLRDCLFGPYGFAWRVDPSDAEREFVVTRLRDSTTPAAEVDADDLVDEGEPYELAEASVVTRVVWVQQQFSVWAGDDEADRPLDGLVSNLYTVRADPADAWVSNASERILTYTVPGRVSSAVEVLDFCLVPGLGILVIRYRLSGMRKKRQK